MGPAPGPSQDAGRLPPTLDSDELRARLAEAERRAREAAEAKREFLAVISHELRTPLTTVIGFSDLLQAGHRGDLSDGQREYVDRIKSSAWHLVGIIDEILAFSRLEAGQEELRREQVELGRLLEDVSSLLESEADSKGLHLSVAAPASPVWLETDGGKLRHLLLKLLSNAIKFTERGEVRLELDVLSPDWLRFLVTDTGPGIPPHQLERIFEPFTQAEPPTTRRSGGTGLGLAVGRKLARLLGGRLSATSTVGAGSTFELRLPRVQPDVP